MAEEPSKGHGRKERRRIEVTGILKGHTKWPGLERAYRIERTRTVRGKRTVEVVHGITSLKVGAAELLALTRAHWGIENGLYYVRDFTFGEDQCRVREGTGPEALACARNVTIHILRTQGFTNMKAGVEHFSERRTEAMMLVRYGRTK